MKSVLLYIRVSTEEQAEKGFSLPAQEEALRKYAKQKELNVVGIFQDDFSAWKGFNRPGYNKLSEFIEKNKKKSATYLLPNGPDFQEKQLKHTLN